MLLIVARMIAELHDCPILEVQFHVTQERQRPRQIKMAHGHHDDTAALIVHLLDGLLKGRQVVLTVG